jgi:hypothetical protein
MHSVAELEGESLCNFNPITPVMLQQTTMGICQQMHLCIDNDSNHTERLYG